LGVKNDLLFVNPGVGVVAEETLISNVQNLQYRLDLRPLGDTLLTEPEVDFLLGVLDAVSKNAISISPHILQHLYSRVGTVADVSADGKGKVTSDGTGGGLQGVGSTQDGSTGLDGVQTLPNHTDDGARVHVLDESGEEGLLLQVLVVRLEVGLTGGTHLQADELRGRDGMSGMIRGR
jgi:hypothetical protein